MPNYKSIFNLVLLTILTAIALSASQDRILTPIDPSATTPLSGQVHMLARAGYDQGAADPSMALSYVTLLLKPDPSINAFLDDLQIPTSPSYHHWITPAQFGDRFGLTRADMAKVVAWLESQGLKVNDVAQGRHWVTFSGTAATVGRALHTTIHRYRVNGKLHFANSTEPRIPAALAGVVAGFGGLHDFGPEPLVILSPVQPQSPGPIDNLTPDYNSGTNHYLAPDDFATIYDVAPLYAAGLDGTGQKIVILGESDVDLTDLRAFRTLFKLQANDPQMVLVGADPGKNGAQVEADLDLEWSAAVARNATVIYVYASSVSVAAEYAVDQNLAPLMSESFGGCEQYDSPAFRAVAQQANAQGITWFASSGDAGATNCDRAALTPQANLGLTVSHPASIPEITAVGGTSYDDSSGVYWAGRNSSTDASALSYIPERAWNDSRTGFEATGGGASAYFTKPFWQTGPGVPDDGARDLPDVSLAASPVKYAYLVESGGSLVAVGGTSCSSPSFAGLAALVSQHLAAGSTQPGLGNINPALYRLAQATTDVFHDITAGDNEEPCSQGSPACVDGLAGYTAGKNYDQTTGLGSVDAYNLVMEWNSGTASSTTLAASPGAAGLSDTVQLTATVSAGSAGAAPTGSVVFLVNGTTAGAASLAASGSTGAAAISVTGTALAVGNGAVSALYSGDGVFTGSAGSTTVSIQVPTTNGSYIVPFLNPNSVPPAANEWPYVVGLTEIAGVSTTLTGFTINGVTQALSSWTATQIPAHGTVFASLVASLGQTAPINRTFVFTGADANGQKWTQQITVLFSGQDGPGFGPAMSVSSAAGASVAYNAQADPSCQWYIPLTVQESGGYYMQLSQLSVAGADMTSQIQPIFGTTRLAPYGSLQGNLCFSAAGSRAVSVSLSGTIEDGYLGGSIPVALPAPVVFSPPPANPPALSVSPQAVAMPAPDGSGNSSAAIALSFTGAGTGWSASVSLGKSTLNWLTASPATGTGSGQLTLQASAAGLSIGAYNATVWIDAPNAVPPVIAIPVTLVVGGSSTVAITGLQNAFSYQGVFAPGMSMSVYGINLAPGTQSASKLPLPLTMQGITASVNGVSAPLYYVSPGQLNIQVPYEIGAGPAIVAVNNGGQVAVFPFTVTMTAPGLYNSAIDNATGLPASSAATGAVLLLFMTGDGDITPFLATGATPSASITNTALLPKPRLPVTVTLGGVPATVLFAGIPSGLAGVTQIDIVVPANAPSGAQNVVVTVGGVAAPPVMLTIQ